PVVAVEPSLTMIRQRPVGSAPVVQASAVQLPFREATFAAALAGFAGHHLPGRARGPPRLAPRVGQRGGVLAWGPGVRRLLAHRELFPRDRGHRPPDLPDD